MEKQKKSKLIHWFIIGTFVTLYVLVSLISTIHVIDFFELSNANWLAITLAIAFEIGAAASLASIIVLDKMNKWIVWALFFILTAMQAMGNTYYAFTHLNDFQGWVELFGLNEEEPLYQKRVLSIVSGAILPLVALGFIKALVDYIRPDYDAIENPTPTPPEEKKEVEEITEEKIAEEPEIITPVPDVDKKPLIDMDSLLAALKMASDQKVAEAAVAADKKKEELAQQQIQEYIQIPVVHSMEELENFQPVSLEMPAEVEPIVEVQPEKYAVSYSEDDVQEEAQEEEKKTQ
jgi:hypothetical protein